MNHSFKWEKKGNIAVVTMLTDTMTHTFDSDMIDLFHEVGNDEDVRVIILKNDGRFFCAGADMDDLAMTTMEFKYYIDKSNCALNLLKNAPQPVIALVNGAAAGGGCNLALTCDFVIASEKAVFREAFVNINTIPDTGGLWTLVPLVGIRKAKELCMTGRKISADEALSLGMITSVTSSDKLFEEGMKLAEELAAKPPAAIRTIKKLCNMLPDLSHEAYCEIEADLMALLSGMADSDEGIRAFIEKRPPVFTGK